MKSCPFQIKCTTHTEIVLLGKLKCITLMYSLSCNSDPLEARLVLRSVPFIETILSKILHGNRHLHIFYITNLWNVPSSASHRLTLVNCMLKPEFKIETVPFSASCCWKLSKSSHLSSLYWNVLNWNLLYRLNVGRVLALVVPETEPRIQQNPKDTDGIEKTGILSPQQASTAMSSFQVRILDLPCKLILSRKIK